MKTLTVKIKGTAPLLLHNGQLADPLNPFTKQLKEVSSKRKKTDADLLEMSNIEWMGGLYLNEDERIIIPALNFEASIRNGAKKSKLGKAVQAGLMVDKDAVLEYKGSKNINDIKEDRNFRLTCAVKIQKNKIMRTRPMFKEWGAEFNIIYNEAVLDKAQVQKSIEDAGLYCGIGDWLPRFGRFEIESIK
jgi:predicted ABC-class ATPase